MNIVIENNVEIPQDDIVTKTLDEMQINDSFEFPRDRRNSIASIISTVFHGNTTKRFFVSVKNQPKGKARVWRIEDAIEQEKTN